MIVLEAKENVRRLAFASPFFDLQREEIRLQITRLTQVPEGQDWATLAETVKADPEHVVIDDRIRIDPATLAIVGAEESGGAPAYSCIVGMTTPAGLGLTALDAPIYPAIAAQVEQFLTINQLI